MIELNESAINKIDKLNNLISEQSKFLPLALTAGLGVIGTGFKIASDNSISDTSHNNINNINHLLKGAGSIANQILGKE